jgi:hypothetical protein
MNRICLHSDIAQMTVALYRAEDQVAMLQRLAYLAAEPLSPMALHGIADTFDDIIDTLSKVSDSLNRAS